MDRLALLREIFPARANFTHHAVSLAHNSFTKALLLPNTASARVMLKREMFDKLGSQEFVSRSGCAPVSHR